MAPHSLGSIYFKGTNIVFCFCFVFLFFLNKFVVKMKVIWQVFTLKLVMDKKYRFVN